MAFKYKPSPVGLRFHESDDPIKMIVGPYGSGKSTIAAEDLLFYAMAQPVTPDGCRYSRWGVIRASYPNLTQTTRRTLMEVMPEGTGTITMGSAPLHGCFKFGLPDGSRVQIEVVLWSAKDGEAAEKFRSDNWTGAWINEATEVDFDVLSKAVGRRGRFPSKDMGGCYWAGAILDFNKPMGKHWVMDVFDAGVLVLQDRVYKVGTFTQPPAAFKEYNDDGSFGYVLNDDAENLENLSGGLDYYALQIALLEKQGKTSEIDSLFCLLDVDSTEGRPVWPMFDVSRHVAPYKLSPIDGLPVVIGFDTSGIHPAAVISQFHNGHWGIVDEIDGDELGLDSFLHASLIPTLRTRYGKSEVIFSVDPANARDSYTGLAPSDHLREAGYRVYVPTTNRPETRIAAVAYRLNMTVGGYLISPTCERLIEAMRGRDPVRGYRYSQRRLWRSPDVVYQPRPEKNDASHIADALQYQALYVNREDSGRVNPAFVRKLAANNARWKRPLVT
jgi:hypothetical protein